MKLCLLFLTCKDESEADKITDALLKKRLVFCIKKYSVSSTYLWKRKIEKANEAMLIMESVETNFEKIEKIIAKYHSYDTFTLVMAPVTKTTDKVKTWIKQELKMD